MGRNTDVDKLKRQVDFEDLVLEDCEKREDHGTYFFVLCPFHEESSASMKIEPEPGLFYCFGCSTGGDIIDWVKQIEGVEFTEAVHILAEREGIDAELSEEAQSRWKAKKRLRNALEKTIDYYRRAFEDAEEAEGARRYMIEERSIDPEVLDDFEIGYAPTGRLSLLNQTDWRDREEELQEIGVIDTPRHGGYRERFGGRIIFPIRNHLGKAAGMAGRVDPTRTEPGGGARGKYENTPDSPIYEKKTILYGLDKARKEIRQQGRSIVVEGYTDVLRLRSDGVANVVASCGTSFSEAQAQRLAKKCKESVFVFDGDEAGYRSEKRTLKDTVPTDLQPRAVRLPEGTDPADLADEQKDIRKVIRQQQTGLVAFLAERARQQGEMKSPKGRVSVLNEVTDVIKEIEDRILRWEYIREVAFELDLPGEEVYVEVAEKRGEKPTERGRTYFRNVGLDEGRQGQLRDSVSGRRKAGREEKGPRTEKDVEGERRETIPGDPAAENSAQGLSTTRPSPASDKTPSDSQNSQSTGTTGTSAHEGYSGAGRSNHRQEERPAGKPADEDQSVSEEKTPAPKTSSAAEDNRTGSSSAKTEDAGLSAPAKETRSGDLGAEVTGTEASFEKAPWRKTPFQGRALLREGTLEELSAQVLSSQKPSPHDRFEPRPPRQRSVGDTRSMEENCDEGRESDPNHNAREARGENDESRSGNGPLPANTEDPGDRQGHEDDQDECEKERSEQQRSRSTRSAFRPDEQKTEQEKSGRGKMEGKAKWPALMSSKKEVVSLAHRMAEGVTTQVKRNPECGEQIVMTLALGIGEAGLQLSRHEIRPAALQNRRVRDVLKEGWELAETTEDRKVGIDDLSFANRSNAREEGIPTSKIGESVGVDPDAIQSHPGGALRGALVGWKSYWVHHLEKHLNAMTGATDFHKVKEIHKAEGALDNEKRRLGKLLSGNRKAVRRQTKLDDLWENLQS